MTTAANVVSRAQAPAADLRLKRTANLRNNSEAVRRSRALGWVIAVGMVFLVMVLMAAYSANLNRVNNELKSENQYLQAEVDSLNHKIGDATNIDKVETMATEELGMVHSDSQNCVTVGDSKSENTNLAATIKEEAYN